MPMSAFAHPIAHRGFHDRASGIIENSRSAFEAAISRGYGIECDLQMSADGVPVVFHDADLKRLVGQDKAVNGVAARELCSMQLLESANGDGPLVFTDFLTLVAGRVPVVVEIKAQATPELAQQLAQAAVKAAQTYTGCHVFKSFDPQILGFLRKAGYRGALGIVTYNYDRPEWHGDLSPTQTFVLRNLLHWPTSLFTFISCEQQSLNRPLIRFLRQAGIKVMSWTVKDSTRVRDVLRHADQIVFEGFEPDP